MKLPKGKSAIGCKWAFIIKYKTNGEVERYKARLVAKGYNQAAGIDYQETFSPVVEMVTVRVVITLAVAENWTIYQIDVYNSFLQGDLTKEVFMELPKGLNVQGELKFVYNLVKSLYELKQASRQWNFKLTEAFLSSGYLQSI